MKAPSTVPFLWLLSAFACLAGLALTAMPAAAQGGGLQVVLLRPGEGESYYAGPDSPRTAVFVQGRVSGGEFDLDQLEVRLAVLHDGQQVGVAQGAPTANGEFSFLVAINADGPEEVGRSSGNCYPCHGMAALALPTGPNLLRATATDPTGHTAVAERFVAMERSEVAEVAVRVGIDGQPQQAAAGLRVSAATGLYGWRSRQFTGLTDGQGQAVLHVEALSQQPTRYRLSVPPSVVDGVLYQTYHPVELVLPPGATTAGPVQLTVEARLGRIAGTLTGYDSDAGEPLSIRAVDLVSGRAFTTAAANDGFAFSNVPLGRYLVTVDTDQAGSLAYRSAGALAELAGETEVSVNLALERVTGSGAVGTVCDSTGAALPFAWLQSLDGQRTQPADPITGVFAWSGLPDGARAARVAAPGYWSRVIPPQPPSAFVVTLRPKPGTRTESWGHGQLVFPSGSLASREGDRVILKRGWLWGHGDQPLTIATAEATLRVLRGAFALEYIPGESAWLYLPEGEGQTGAPGEDGVRIKAGEMVQFAGREIGRPQPVPLDGAAARVFQSRRPAPFALEAEPGWWSRLTDTLAPAGIALPAAAPAALGPLVLLIGGGTAALWLIGRRRRRWLR